MTTKHVVADDVFGTIAKRQWELNRRVLEGTLDPAWVASELQRVVEGRGSNEVYHVIVDYGMSLADMIWAGKYDWVNSDITSEHFPITGSGKIEGDLVLVHLNRSASTDEVRKELESRGLRPATIAELLAFGVKYPNKQREFPIIALGSVWQRPVGRCHVAGLGGSASRRDLRLYWCEDGWDGGCRFLASRK